MRVKSDGKHTPLRLCVQVCVCEWIKVLTIKSILRILTTANIVACRKLHKNNNNNDKIAASQKQFGGEVVWENSKRELSLNLESEFEFNVSARHAHAHTHTRRQTIARTHTHTHVHM